MNKINKKIPQNKIEQEFWEGVQNNRLQGWEWIVIHQNWFLDRMSRNQSCHSGEILKLPKVISFFVWVDISLLSPLLAFFCPYCNTIKRKYTSYRPYLTKCDISWGVTESLYYNVCSDNSYGSEGESDTSDGGSWCRELKVKVKVHLGVWGWESNQDSTLRYKNISYFWPIYYRHIVFLFSFSISTLTRCIQSYTLLTYTTISPLLLHYHV